MLVSYYTGNGLVRFRTDGTPELVDAMTMGDFLASPDARHFAAIGFDQRLRRGTDLHLGGKLEVCDDGGGVKRIALAPDGSGIVTALQDAIELRCPREPGDIRYAIDGNVILSVAAAPGWLAAGARDGSVRLWRRGQSEPIAVFRDHSARVDALVMDPAGTWFAAGGWDGRVAFFDVPGSEPDSPGLPELGWGIDLQQVFAGHLPAGRSSLWSAE